MRRVLLLLLAGLAALAPAGCGGGGDKSGGTLTKAELVAQANAICKDYDARIDALGEPESIEDLVGLAEKAKPIAEDGVAKLRALKAPEDLQARYDEYLAAGDANVDMLTELRDAAKTGDIAAVSKVGDAGQVNSDKGKKIASELGLTECAKED